MRRDDLRVERNVFDYGPELLVSILRDGEMTGRQFGVALKGRVPGARPPRVDKASLKSNGSATGTSRSRSACSCS